MTATDHIRTILDWGVAGRALEDESGDAHVVAPFSDGVLLAVIDGLGHGPEAAAAARRAVAVLDAHAGEPVRALIARCHEALRGSRGAVLSLAALDRRDGSLTWAGVGNVEGVLFPADRRVSGARYAIELRGGVVGFQLPPLKETRVGVFPGDTIVLASDGIKTSFTEAVPVERDPQQIADAILAHHAKGTDDALVLVARYWGMLR